MRSIPLSLPTSIGLMFAAAALFVTGCGQGEYDSRMSGAAGAITRRATQASNEKLTRDFVSVRGSDQVSKGIKLRLPACFGKPGVKSLGESDANGKVPQVDIPGFCYSLEGRLTDENNKQVSCYCYMYGAPKAMHTIDQVRDKIKQDVAMFSPDAIWATNHNKVVAQPNFDFNYPDGTTENRPGLLALQLIETPENIVVIGFRCPRSTAPEVLDFTFTYDKALDTITPDVPAPAAPAPAAPGNPGK